MLHPLIRPLLSALPRGIFLILMGALATTLFVERRAEGLPQPGAMDAREIQREAPLPAGPGLVVLTTDFGERGYLLGALKGAIYGSGPEGLRIDAISNDISRFDVEEGSVVLALGAESYPRGTIFVGMVSPDKSGPRPIVCVITRTGHVFLSPDNGLLTQVALRYGVESIHRIGPPAEAAPGTSRDVLGPAAGAIARGVHPRELGMSQGALYLLQAPPAQLFDDHVEGAVTLVDGFGNAHTNIQEAHLLALGIKPGGELEIIAGERSLKVPWVGTYADVNLMQPLALLSQHGELKLSINQGDLAETLGLGRGGRVMVRPASGH